MLLVATILVLALWLAFVWFADPDGLRRAVLRGYSRRFGDRK